MRYKMPFLLWTLVVIVAATMFYLRTSNRSAQNQTPGHSATDNDPEDGNRVQIDSEGRAFANVPWKHFPNIEPFKLIDQNGDTFDSADLTGQAYVVSFFFASCPTFCRDLNKEIERVNAALKDTDIRFLTITVDPAKDTPEVLHKYAEGFGAEPARWAFLTGQKYELVEIGEHSFNVRIDPDTHTDNILLVDKWGRYRDRFKWDQPYDMQRFVEVAKQVAAETDPPIDKTFKTRNVLAGFEQPDLNNVRWVREFHLTERSGKKFYSRDSVGEVWIANFFFSTCPGICKAQNEYLRDLQKRLDGQCPQIVSITTDANTDTPEHLREFATNLGADPMNWLFLTGDRLLIKRIGSEYFKADSGDEHHSSLLYVVDRWGDVRGSFDWGKASEEIAMLRLIDQLESETRPQRPNDRPKRKTETEDEE